MNLLIYSLLPGFVLLDFEAYTKGGYYINSSVIATWLLAFIVGILGFQLLWEKMAVPSVVLLLTFVLGAFLGLDVKPLGGSDLVIGGSLIATGLFVALNLEMTLVGFAVMAIVFGFFHGHAFGQNIPDSDNAVLYIITSTVVIALCSLLGILIQRVIPKTSYLQIIGIIVSILGIVLLVL